MQIGKQEIGLICRWYDDVHRNSQGTYQKKNFLTLVSEFGKSEDTTLTYIRKPYFCILAMNTGKNKF